MDETQMDMELYDDMTKPEIGNETHIVTTLSELKTENRNNQMEIRKQSCTTSGGTEYRRQ